MDLNQFVKQVNDQFLSRWNTVLVGGFNEPEYLPARLDSDVQRPAEIRFTRDYLRSALHEIAHWSIAGDERRLQVDYGYWYRPDGRNTMEQAEFFRVEVKPQAIEKMFSKVLGVQFEVSCDNLNGDVSEQLAFEIEFEKRVDHQISLYEGGAMPDRAGLFLVFLKDLTSK